MSAIGVLVEQVVSRASPEAIATARGEFHERTGFFEPADASYEERIQAFFDWALIEWRRGELLRRELELGRVDRALGRALLGSMRSLFLASAGVRGVEVQCLLGGARFSIEEPDAARLRDGDLFDARVLGLSGRVCLAPGIVFHPREAHEPLVELLARARDDARPDTDLLDSLLRMRMRLDRFAGMPARHIYRYEGLDQTEIRAAAWATGR